MLLSFSELFCIVHFEVQTPYKIITLPIKVGVFQYLKKMNRQERVVEEVKAAIKPHYAAGRIDKHDYKEIMRKAVPKVPCATRFGFIS